MTMCNLRRKTIKLMNYVLSFLPLIQHTHRVNIFVCSLNFIYLLADSFVVLLIYTQMNKYLLHSSMQLCTTSCHTPYYGLYCHV